MATRAAPQDVRETVNDVFDDVLHRAIALRRTDVIEGPLRALALRARRFSPRAARRLVVLAQDAPRRFTFAGLVAVIRRDRIAFDEDAERMRAALDGVLTLPPLSPPPDCPDRSVAAVVAYAKQHHVESILYEPPRKALVRITGGLPRELLPMPPTRDVLALAEHARWRPLIAHALTVEACIAPALAESLVAPFPIRCDGPYANERRAWVERALAHALPVDDPWSEAGWTMHAQFLDDGINCFDVATGSHGSFQMIRPGGVRIRIRDPLPDASSSLVRRALLFMVDIVNETEPRRELPIVERWFAPRHAELLAALRGLATPKKKRARTASDREERIGWEIAIARYGVTVTPVLQKATKKSGFTKGTRITYRQVLEHPRASEQDKRAAATLSAHYQLQPDHLRALVGHPLVFDEQRRPWELVAVDARASLVEAQDGWRVQIEPPLQVDGGDDEVQLDHDQRIIRIVGVSDEIAAVARAAQRAEIIPASAAKELHEILNDLDEQAPVALPASLQGEPIDADTRIYVRLQTDPMKARIGVRPLPHGALFAPGEGASEVVGLVDGTRRRAARNLDAERETAIAVRDLLSLDNLVAEDDWTFAPSTPDATLDLVEQLQNIAKARADVVVEWKEGAQKVAVVGNATPQELAMSVRGIDTWLSVDGNLALDEESVTLGALLEAVRQGRRYVRISDDRFVKLSAQLRSRLTPLAAFANDASANAIELAPSLAGALDDLANDGVQFADTDTWRTLAKRAQDARAQTDDPPAALNAELRAYQRAGVRFLRRLAAWGTGGVLADDMGLGKTVQAISLLIDRAERGPQLVLAPTSVGFNWQREIERFAPSLRAHALSGTESRKELIDKLDKRDILVAGYALAVQCAEMLVAKRFASVVLDEAQAIKNADTLRARLARDLDAEWKVALTGTPLENHLGELWSIFRVTSPGLLGSLESFRNRYMFPIERDRSVQKRQELAQVLRPFLLRRTKREVAPELPPRTEIVVPVELSDDERKRYHATRAAILADVVAHEEDAVNDRRFRVLAGLTRLRLLTCHPRLVDPDAPDVSAKLDAVLHTIRDLRENNHKALVFSQFVKHLEIVRAALDGESVRYLMLDGSTPERERAKLVDQFQAGAADVFLLSLKAGGAGLNLTAADFVLHLDPWWNPAVEDQATGRAHRIGQERPVTVYRFIARGTIEEQMIALHDEKRDLVDGVLEGADAAAKLSVDDLVALLRI